MTERYAIYYAPAEDDPLWGRAAEWLGRDPSDGSSFATPVAGIERDRLVALTVSARRYGFHATMKPPMPLGDGKTAEALAEALGAFAATQAPVEIGPLRVASLDGFLALIPDDQPPALTDLAGRVVEHFDEYRAPLDEFERTRRLAGGPLSDRQIELLERFGYPYVLDQFRFHMTLTDRLAEADHADLERAAESWFASDVGTVRRLDRLALFHESEPGAPFARVAEFVLEGG